MCSIRFPKPFLRALEAINRGICPGYDDLKFFKDDQGPDSDEWEDKGWFAHLNYEQKEKVKECWSEYEDLPPWQ